MENESKSNSFEHQQQPTLCRGGCGFFGSAASGNYCSICFKKTMAKQTAVASSSSATLDAQQSSKEAMLEPAIPLPPTSSAEAAPTLSSSTATSSSLSLPSSSSTVALSTSAEQQSSTQRGEQISADVKSEEKLEGSAEETGPIQKNRKRCYACKKKVGLTGIECRCGFVFCGSHRYAQQHNCTFDYKAADREELKRRNPGGGLFEKVEKL